MTAEVAVLNRSAVALAADSAVTLSGPGESGGVAKIFQNENKLFEASKHCPIGLMIYNATTLFEIPWEVIIKSFRSDIGTLDKDHLFEWWDIFNEYIINHNLFRPSSERQSEFFGFIISDEFNLVLMRFLRKIRPLIFAKQTNKVTSSYDPILEEIIVQRISFYERSPFYVGFDQDVCDRLLILYDKELNEAINQSFSSFPIVQQHKDALKKLASAIIGRSSASWFTTGIVFAGFGKNEIFPSLRSVEIGGMLGDRLRWSEIRKVDIDRAKSTAEIIPFAQRESVDTLLYGRSEKYQQRVLEYFKEAML